MKKQSIIVQIVRKRIFMMIMIFVIMLAVFSIMTKGAMLNPRNLLNILSAMAVSAFLTTGISMLMISGRLDLSTGANGTLCGMLIAYLLRGGMAFLPALIVSLALGAIVGLANAALVNELNMAPFIATLATSSVATGLVYLIANKKTIDIFDPVMQNYGSYMLFNYIPVSILFAFAFMIIIGVILHKTTFGRQIYLVGGNAQASMLSGINPKKMSYILFMVCGVFSSAAGITLTARTHTATIQGLVLQRFQGITAAVLGGISFGGGAGGMAGAFVGLLVLNTFSNGLVVIGMSPYLQNVATGLLLIVALALDFFQQKQSQKVVV